MIKVHICFWSYRVVDNTGSFIKLMSGIVFLLADYTELNYAQKHCSMSRMETIPNVYSFARTVSNPAKVRHSGYWPVDGFYCQIHHSFGTVYQLNPQKKLSCDFSVATFLNFKQNQPWKIKCLLTFCNRFLNNWVLAPSSGDGLDHISGQVRKSLPRQKWVGRSNETFTGCSDSARTKLLNKNIWTPSLRKGDAK